MSELEQLQQMTTIVVDTGDIDAIKKFKPTDATTNPSLILKACQKPQYRHLLEEAVKDCRPKAHSKEEYLKLVIPSVFVKFGVEILKLVPGRVSTEVDARLSFDAKGSIEMADKLIALYEAAGISKERVLIKLASTWEGIKAARLLEKKGIHCNMTLLFSLPQAVECAKAKATLISPFVGRILDWYKKAEGKSEYASHEDPGVISVTEIYNYYKKYGHKTQVMGASFRNKGEILELAGCDLLTIAPELLAELTEGQGSVTRKLDPKKSKKLPNQKLKYDESEFRFALNDNAMATEKLAEGIRVFAKDTVKLEEFILQQFPY